MNGIFQIQKLEKLPRDMIFIKTCTRIFMTRNCFNKLFQIRQNNEG